MRFKNLLVGQEFDWIDPDKPLSEISFTRPCKKVSVRKYRTTGGGPIEEFQVGAIDARVFNVKPLRS